MNNNPYTTNEYFKTVRPRADQPSTKSTAAAAYICSLFNLLFTGAGAGDAFPAGEKLLCTCAALSNLGAAAQLRRQWLVSIAILGMCCSEMRIFVIFEAYSSDLQPLLDLLKLLCQPLELQEVSHAGICSQVFGNGCIILP